MSQTQNLKLNIELPDTTLHKDFVKNIDANMQIIDSAVNEKVNKIILTAIIDTIWLNTEAPFIQTVLVDGIKASDNPIVDIIFSENYNVAKEEMNDWGKIYQIETFENKLKIYATSVTTHQLKIQIEVLR